MLTGAYGLSHLRTLNVAYEVIIGNAPYFTFNKLFANYVYKVGNGTAQGYTGRVYHSL